MSISVESRIHRTLRGVAPFKEYEQWDQLKHLDPALSPLDRTERLLGVYENDPGCADGLVVFTTLGVYWRENETWRSVRYGEIAGTEWPKEAKDEARSLTIRIRTGSCEYLPIRRGYFFDVMRFFDRVAEDTRHRNDDEPGGGLGSS